MHNLEYFFAAYTAAALAIAAFLGVLYARVRRLESEVNRLSSSLAPRKPRETSS